MGSEWLRGELLFLEGVPFNVPFTVCGHGWQWMPQVSWCSGALRRDLAWLSPLHPPNASDQPLPPNIVSSCMSAPVLMALEPRIDVKDPGLMVLEPSPEDVRAPRLILEPSGLKLEP